MIETYDSGHDLVDSARGPSTSLELHQQPRPSRRAPSPAAMADEADCFATVGWSSKASSTATTPESRGGIFPTPTGAAMLPGGRLSWPGSGTAWPITMTSSSFFTVGAVVVGAASKAYSAEFRRDAVALYENSPGVSIWTVAPELRVNRNYSADLN